MIVGVAVGVGVGTGVFVDVGDGVVTGVVVGVVGGGGRAVGIAVAVSGVNCPRTTCPVVKAGCVLMGDAKEALTDRSPKLVRTTQIPAGADRPIADGVSLAGAGVPTPSGVKPVRSVNSPQLNTKLASTGISWPAGSETRASTHLAVPLESVFPVSQKTSPVGR